MQGGKEIQIIWNPYLIFWLNQYFNEVCMYDTILRNLGFFSYFLVCFGGKKEEQYAQVNFCTWKKSAQGSDILVESENEYGFTQIWQNDPVEERKWILPHFFWILLLFLNKIKSVFFLHGQYDILLVNTHEHMLRKGHCEHQYFIISSILLHLLVLILQLNRILQCLDALWVFSKSCLMSWYLSAVRQKAYLFCSGRR